MDKKTNSALEATKVSMLYLYQAYKEEGFTDEEAKSEIAYQVIEELKRLDTMKDYINIHLDSNNLELLSTLHKQVGLITNSKQQHVAQVGSRIAELITKLFA